LRHPSCRAIASPGPRQQDLPPAAVNSRADEAFASPGTIEAFEKAVLAVRDSLHE